VEKSRQRGEDNIGMNLRETGNRIMGLKKCSVYVLAVAVTHMRVSYFVDPSLVLSFNRNAINSF